MCDFLFLNYTILCLNPLNESIRFSTKHVNFFVSVISQFFRATTLIPNVTAKRPEFDRNQKMAKKKEKKRDNWTAAQCLETQLYRSEKNTSSNHREDFVLMHFNKDAV